MAWISVFALSAAAFGGVTYSGNVKTILDNNCIECHHAGGRDPDLSAFPFASPTMSDQGQIVSKILEMVQTSADGTAAKMPPGARPKLSDSDVQTLKDWQAQGLQP